MATATPPHQEMELDKLLGELRRDMKRHNASGRDVVRSLARLESFFAARGVKVVLDNPKEKK